MSKEWSPFRAYSARRNKFWPWPDFLAMAIIFAFIIFTIGRAIKLPQYDWQWPLLSEFIIRRAPSGSLEPGLLLKGLFTTFRVGFWSFLLALVAGGSLGLFWPRKSWLASLPYHLYVNIIRNTPPLVILFFVYFFAGNILPVAALEDFIRQLPSFWRDAISILFAPAGQMDRMLAATIALGAYQGAYVAEIARAGVRSVPPGQWDAALALGFSRAGALKNVILPQAIRLILPPLTGQAITSFKDSALASLISIPDLTFQSLEIMAISQMTFEIWISAAILYLVLGAVCASLGFWLERRFSRHMAISQK